MAYPCLGRGNERRSILNRCLIARQVRNADPGHRTLLLNFMRPMTLMLAHVTMRLAECASSVGFVLPYRSKKPALTASLSRHGAGNKPIFGELNAWHQQQFKRETRPSSKKVLIGGKAVQAALSNYLRQK